MCEDKRLFWNVKSGDTNVSLIVLNQLHNAWELNSFMHCTRDICKFEKHECFNLTLSSALFVFYLFIVIGPIF